MKLKISLERVVSIVGLLFIGTALWSAIILNGDPDSIIPYSKQVIVTVHTICTLLTIFTIFKPSTKLHVIVFFIESILLILTNYEMLGVMFFYSALAEIKIMDFMKNKRPVNMTIIFVLHIINILFMYTHGWSRTIITLGTSAFMCTFYLWLYSLLKAKFSCIIPTTISENKCLKNKKVGSLIHLSDYNLSERQMQLILDNLHNNLSYKELSDKYFMSISLVKKEFAYIFKVFDVSKIEELHMLLLQYLVEK